MQFAPVRDPARLLFFGMLTAAVLYALPSALQLGAHDHDEMGNLEKAATASGLHLRQHRRGLSHHDHGAAAAQAPAASTEAGLHGDAHPGSGHWRPHAGDKLYNSPLPVQHMPPASFVSSESHIRWQTVPGTEPPSVEHWQSDHGDGDAGAGGSRPGSGSDAFPIRAMPMPRPGPAGDRVDGDAGTTSSDWRSTVSAAVIPPVPQQVPAAHAPDFDTQSEPQAEPQAEPEPEPPILPDPGTLSMRDLHMQRAAAFWRARADANRKFADRGKAAAQQRQGARGGQQAPGHWQAPGQAQARAGQRVPDVAEGQHGGDSSGAIRKPHGLQGHRDARDVGRRTAQPAGGMPQAGRRAGNLFG